MLQSAWGYLPMRLRGDAGRGKAEAQAAEKAEMVDAPKSEARREGQQGGWASNIAGSGKEGLNKAQGWAGSLLGGGSK